ncbi:MAG TPA: lipopolysaccharide heptosyltransferase II [Planctomycetota bacterium]|nr:lipopolysaccharide heptosyltransferase II [Planctomycetota bacterium]
MAAYDRIFVRLPNWVGDVAMATPILQALRRAYPRARIAWGLRPAVEGVVRGAPWADVLYLERGKGVLGVSETARTLRAERFDLAVLLPHSFQTALVAALAGARARVGFGREGRGWLLTHALRAPRRGLSWLARPTPHFYREIASAVGVEVPSLKPVLPFETAVAEEVARMLGAAGVRRGEVLFGFAPGASFGASKLWNPSSFASVADELLRRHGAKGVILTAPSERAIGDAIAAQARMRLARVEDWIDLHRLKPLAARLSLLVTTDAGPRHYAAAFDVPIVALLGPNRPEWTNETLERTKVVRIDVPCGPCHLKRCPLDRWCMEGIRPPEVLDAAEDLLRRFPPAPRDVVALAADQRGA